MRKGLAVAILCAFIIVAPAVSAGAASASDSSEFQSLVNTVKANPNYSTFGGFLDLIVLSGQVDAFLGKPLTLLIPNNNALKNFNIISFGIDKARTLITYHVLVGKIGIKGLRATPFGTRLRTLNSPYNLIRKRTTFTSIVRLRTPSDAKGKIYEGLVVRPNFFLGNKLVAHGVDTLFFPPNL